MNPTNGETVFENINRIARAILRQAMVAVLVGMVFLAIFVAACISALLILANEGGWKLVVVFAMLCVVLWTMWKVMPPYHGGFAHAADFWTGFITGAVLLNLLSYAIITVVGIGELNFFLILALSVMGGKAGLTVAWVKSFMTEDKVQEEDITQELPAVVA